MVVKAKTLIATGKHIMPIKCQMEAVRIRFHLTPADTEGSNFSTQGSLAHHLKNAAIARV